MKNNYFAITTPEPKGPGDKQPCKVEQPTSSIILPKNLLSLSFSLYIYIHIYLSLSLSLSLSRCVSVYLFIYIHIYKYILDMKNAFQTHCWTTGRGFGDLPPLHFARRLKHRLVATPRSIGTFGKHRNGCRGRLLGLSPKLYQCMSVILFITLW